MWQTVQMLDISLPLQSMGEGFILQRAGLAGEF